MSGIRDWRRNLSTSSIPIDKKFNRACELWEEYYKKTEDFDRSVCTGSEGKDGVLPANSEERSAIEKNALGLLSLARWKAQVEGIPPATLERARIHIGFNSPRGA